MPCCTTSHVIVTLTFLGMAANAFGQEPCGFPSCIESPCDKVGIKQPDEDRQKWGVGGELESHSSNGFFPQSLNQQGVDKEVKLVCGLFRVGRGPWKHLCQVALEEQVPVIMCCNNKYQHG